MKIVLKILLYLSGSMVIALANTTLDIKIASGYDDAEENIDTGKMSLYSSDLELIEDGTKEQLVGLRFKNIKVPKGVTITHAYLQFSSDEINDEFTEIMVHGELTPNAKKFRGKAGDISGRIQTTASVDWNNISAWEQNRERGIKERSSDIAPIIQEIIDQDGWKKGKALVLILSGSGKRVAKSYNGSRTHAPLLHIEYSIDSSVEPIQGMVTYKGEDGEERWGTSDVYIYEIEEDGSLVLRWQEITSMGVLFSHVGYFNTHTNALDCNKYYLYKVTGGIAYEMDDDEAPLGNTPNTKVLRAIVKGGDMITLGSRFRINDLTENFYHYIEKSLDSEFNYANLEDIMSDTPH